MLLIDDREGSVDLVYHEPVRSLAPPCPDCGGGGDGASCTACRGTGRQLIRLSSGDVALAGYGPAGRIKVGVEVKSVSDCLASIETGRLQAQLTRMIGDYDTSWLLVYGDTRGDRQDYLQYALRPGEWQATNGRQLTLSDYTRAMIELTWYGIHIEQVPTLARAVRWLADLHAMWRKPWDQHKLMRTFDESRSRVALPPGSAERDPKFVLRAETASRWPGIGYETALAVARHFPTIEAMATASVDEWAAVEIPSRKVSNGSGDGSAGRRSSSKFGKKRAQSVKWALT